MKRVFKFSILLAVLTIAIAGCKKNDPEGGGGKSGKLSPPSWIRGTWEGYGLEFQFTSNDVIMNGESFKQIFNLNEPGVGKTTIKETKNTSSLYEFATTITETGGGSEKMTWSFKKGDGSYIEFGIEETGTKITDYITLDKQ